MINFFIVILNAVSWFFYMYSYICRHTTTYMCALNNPVPSSLTHGSKSWLFKKTNQTWWCLSFIFLCALEVNSSCLFMVVPRCMTDRMQGSKNFFSLGFFIGCDHLTWLRCLMRMEMYHRWSDSICYCNYFIYTYY